MWKVHSDYVTANRIKAMRNRRGDDKTFASECKNIRLDSNSLVAQVAATNRIGAYEYLADATTDPRFPRQRLAKEFGIKGIRILLTKGGVLEYGVPVEEQLA